MWWREVEVTAGSGAVWELLTDTQRWPAWGPTVSDARLDEGGTHLGPGSTGLVRTPLGVWLPFEVTTWREGEAWGWRVAGVPATEHEVRADSRSTSRVRMGVPVWAPAYLLVVEPALRRIRRLAELGDP